MSNIVAKIVRVAPFIRNSLMLRSNLQQSKTGVLNSTSVLVRRLLVQHNIQFVNTIKTTSDTPPSPMPATDDRKKEKQSRQKTVKVKPGISDHDLNIKITNICAWLQKGSQVSVYIAKDNNKPEAGDKLFSRLVDASKDVATVKTVKQARETSTSTNFMLLPNTRSSDDTEVSLKSDDKDRLFTLDELREIRSKESLPDNDKS